MDDLYFPLLKSWCDRLIELQVRDTGVKSWTAAFSAPPATSFTAAARTRFTR